MSLDTTLARISQLDAMLSPRPVVPQTAAGSAAATMPASGTSPTSGTSPASASSFATALQGAIAPTMTTMQSGGPPASAIVRIAESQVGQTEQPPGSNDSPAIAQYRTATAGAQAGQPWCAYFASWVAQQAGEPIGPGGQGLGYVGDIWSWAQQTGRAIPNGPGVTPAPGDLIVFGDHHVGIVEQVMANGDVQTIEGNYSNAVSRVVRAPGEASGYVRM